MKKGLILLLCLLLLITPALGACGEPEDVSGEAVSSTPPGDESVTPKETEAETETPGNTILASDLLATAEAAFDELPPCAVYSSEGTPADTMLLINMFTGNMEFDEDYNILPPAEFAAGGAVLDYAIHTPSGKNAVEIVVLLAKDAESVAAARALCQYRLDWMLSDKNDVVLYDSTASAILEDAEIYVNGNYVFLLATPDNAAVKVAVDSLLG